MVRVSSKAQRAAIFAAFLALAAASHDSAPRVELHVHFDGSTDVGALQRICQARGITLPGAMHPPESQAEVLQALMALPTWKRFDLVNDIIGGDHAIIAQAARDFVAFQARSGVAYTEVRYDPVRLARSAYANGTLEVEDVVATMRDALAAGAREHGVAVYQLLCAMRGQSAAACDRTVDLAHKMRSNQLGGVVGVDLAGDESSYPNGPYVACLRRAKLELGLNTTIHAGEFKDVSVDEVVSAVLDMHADRIGHGYAAARNVSVLKLLRERQVHVEACPASALNHGLLNSIGDFKTAGLKFGLNTDDPVSFFGNLTLPGNEALVKKKLGFTALDIRIAYENARSAAFGPAVALPQHPGELLTVFL